MQIDEKSGFIYLLPRTSKLFYAYTLEGKFLGRQILAGGFVPKGNFNIQDDGSYTIVSLPLPGVKWIVYHVGTEKLLDTISAAPFRTSGGQFAYNDEIYYDRHHSSIYIQRNNIPQQDSLYHYKPGANRLIPKFTVNYGNMEIPLHFYREVGDYFLAVTSVMSEGNERRDTYAIPDKELVINKKACKRINSGLSMILWEDMRLPIGIA